MGETVEMRVAVRARSVRGDELGKQRSIVYTRELQTVTKTLHITPSDPLDRLVVFSNLPVLIPAIT